MMPLYFNCLRQVLLTLTCSLCLFPFPVLRCYLLLLVVRCCWLRWWCQCCYFCFCVVVVVTHLVLSTLRFSMVCISVLACFDSGVMCVKVIFCMKISFKH